jgi:branched-chain amino acid aminotransferase
VVGAWGRVDGRLRITVTGGPGPMGSARGDDGPTLLVSAAGLTPDRSPTDVVVVPWTRNERGALAGVKSTSYGENVVALARARAAGASEALFANTRGDLCEGTGSNVFVGLDGRLVTPPLSSGCLEGVTRALLLEALAEAGTPAAEESLPLSVLEDADEAFLVSTTREVQAVHHVDGRALPTSPGPLTDRAAGVWDRAYGPGTPTDP